MHTLGDSDPDENQTQKVSVSSGQTPVGVVIDRSFRSFRSTLTARVRNTCLIRTCP